MGDNKQAGVTHQQQQQVQLSHNGNDQVASSNTSMHPTSTMVMAAPQQAILPQQAMQSLQSPTITQMTSQGASTNITTMTTGPPQQMTDWQDHGRVQVIQQPIQNPSYIQPVYNAQGQLIVPGNIALHPGNINQQIQLITAGKPFQPGQMPHMLTTTQGKPIVQGQATSFPGYATIPTSGNNQTLVISQLGVLGQTNLQQQPKPQDMQKMMTKTNVANNNLKAATNQQQSVSISNLVSSQPQGITSQPQTIIQPQLLSPVQYTCNTPQQRAVPQGTPMQFTHWPATFGPTGLPQGLTWAPSPIQGSALLTQGGQIFIRNPQQEQTGMFVHNAQLSTIPQPNQMAQPINKPNQGAEAGGNVQVQPKTPIPKTFSAILPNSIGGQIIRPASSVSTQTGQSQASVHQAGVQSLKTGTKVRTKNSCRMPSVPTTPKSDASNQTKSASSSQLVQPKYVLSNVQPGTAVNASPEKVGKPVQNQQLVQQQQQHQQQQPQGIQAQPPPLTQIQQMQNIFQDQVDQKSQSGQLMVSNGIPNAGDRAVMPVVSMPPGQMAPIMGNMIVQTVPGITTMTPGLPIPPGQPVQGVPIAQEMVQPQNPVPLGPQIKQMTREQKEAVADENVGTKITPDRPSDENAPFPEESGGGTSSSDVRTENTEVPEPSVEKTPDEGDKKSNDKESTTQPKAMVRVKPQILTHVIEGFVIQESSEPFPVVSRNVDGSDGLLRRMPTNEVLHNGDTTTNEVLENGEPPKKKALTDEQREIQEESVNNSVNPFNWTVAEVCDFIRNIPGCTDYAEDFVMHDIDGQALMLLKADHLISAMSMKLGPALKIIAKIDEMRGQNTSSKEAS